MTASSEARFHRKMMDKLVRKIGYDALLKKCPDKNCKVHHMSSQRKTVIEELKNSGWIYQRQSGSHQIFKSPHRAAVISVPLDGKATNPRVFTAILCQIKNGTKFERREKEKGATMEAQLQPAAKPPSIPPELKAKILADMGGKLHEDKERWMQFPKFPDYEISSLGNVRRTYRSLSSGVRTKLEHPIPAVVFTAKKGDLERRMISLYIGGKSTVISIVKALADAFLPPAPGMFAMPKNGDYMDCRADNVRWATKSEILQMNKVAPKLEKAPKEKKTADGKRGPKEFECSEEKILAAAAAFEEGATIDKAGEILGCSHPTAIKQLVKFFGESEYKRLASMSRSERRNVAKTGGKVTDLAPVPASAPYVPAVAVEIPPRMLRPKTPEMAAGLGYPTVAPQFSLTDISSMKAAVRGGCATVVLEMDMSSPTFMLLCCWAPAKK